MRAFHWSSLLWISCIWVLGTNAQSNTLQVALGADGRVILTLYGVPGSLCYVTAQDAAVICRNVGALGSGAATGSVDVASGAKIWLSVLRCRGTESRVEDCPKGTWTPASCPSNRVSTVRCRTSPGGPNQSTTLRFEPTTPNPGRSLTARLQTGSTATRGRLVLSYYGQEGRICSDGFGPRDAQVVCRMLGLRAEGATVTYETPLSGKIWMTSPNCQGHEQSLLDCGATWSPAICPSGTDAGVDCYRESPAAAFVRLDGGPDRLHGSLYIRAPQGEGTVCSSTFGGEEVAVVCRMLTGSTLGSLGLGHLYGPGTGTSVSTNFQCRGSETSLDQCPYTAGFTACDHSDDVSIACGNLVNPGQVPFSIELVGGPSRLQGRVEVTYYGRTGTVCSDAFGAQEARVVCRALNYYGDESTMQYIGNYYGPAAESTPILLSRLNCRGTENSFAECPSQGWGKHLCNHRQDVSVTCGNTGPVTAAPTVPTPSPPRPAYKQVVLIGGADYKHGVLNVLSEQDGWKTVCSVGFSPQDLGVVCRMITSRPTTGLLLDHLYGSGTYTSVTPNFNCQGTESNLNECPHGSGAFRPCSHSDDVSISCGNLVFPVRPAITARLEGGPDSMHGRLVVTYYGQSGTVCGDSFSTREAEVVCRMLGYIGRNDAYYVGSQYGAGHASSPVLLADVQCRGTETTLDECQNSGWNRNSCPHSRDVSIHCGQPVQPSPTPSTTLQPAYSRVILQGGPDQLHGVLTVQSADGSLQTVCSDSFTTLEVAVVCRMLTGRSTEGQLLGRLYGAGSFPQLAVNFRCRGSESGLHQCPYDSSSSYCYQSAGISVSCGNLATNEAAFSVSLVGGPTRLHGLLQVTYYGQTGTVCNNLFGVEEARVVCRSLGYNDPYTVYFNRNTYGTGSESMPILLDRLTCSGSETTLRECQSAGWGQHSCTHSQDVSIDCGPTYPLTPEPTRPPQTLAPISSRVELVGGPDRLHGVLIVTSSRGSGTVCNRNLGVEVASVVCRMLTGRLTAGTLLDQLYGPTTGPVLSLNVACRGDEYNLDQCPYGRRPEACRHPQDVSIGCGPLETGSGTLSVWLAGGPDRFHGRLHVRYYGETGTVCRDGFDAQDATVVCRMLGYVNTYNDAYPVGTQYGPGAQDMGVLMSDLSCRGTELSLDSCRHAGWRRHSCTHNSDISIHCGPIQSVTQYTPLATTTLWLNPAPGGSSMFLVGGPDRFHGRVMVQRNQENGTVCDDQFDDVEAQVICRMLGYYGSGAVSAKTFFGAAPAGTRIWLSRLACTGTEPDLQSCNHGGWDNNDCQHHEDVGVLCGPRLTRGPPVRVFLVDGPDRFHGRLMVEYGYSNGTVCDDDFDAVDAQVVCRMLGYRGSDATVTEDYGEGSGKVWLSRVMCVGNEESISDCFYPPWGQTDCDHAEDVGVSCGPIRPR